MEKFINMKFEYNRNEVKLSKEQTKENFKICDSIFFTDCVTDDLTLGSLFEILPYVKNMAKKENFNLNRANDFKIAKRIMFNSVKYN